MLDWLLDIFRKPSEVCARRGHDYILHKREALCKCWYFDEAKKLGYETSTHMEFSTYIAHHVDVHDQVCMRCGDVKPVSLKDQGGIDGLTLDSEWYKELCNNGITFMQ